MTESARTPLPPRPAREGLPTSAILRLVGKGMSAREILRLFPELTHEDVRSALLRAADVVRDENAKILEGDPVGEVVARAQQHSQLSEDEAMLLAVEEVRAERQERATRGK